MIMKFGYFDDASKEYVITTPKTPLPWINYLGCNDFFTLISNTCGGYTFYKDAKLLRITRYRYNDVPGDINGRAQTLFPYTTHFRSIPAGNPPRQSLINTNAATVSAIPDLPVQKMMWKQACLPSFPWMTAVR